MRETFRRFELREPLRRLEEALGSADAAAPAPEAEQSLAANVREAPVEKAGTLHGELLALAVEAPETPEDALFAEDRPWRFGVYGGGPLVLTGDIGRPEDLVAAVGERAVAAHDAKALGTVPANLVHDTVVAAYLLEPARRGYPFRELGEERGLGTEMDDGPAADAVVLHALASWQREQLDARGLGELFDEVELPLVRVLRDMEEAGVRLDTRRLREVSTRLRDESAALEREIWDLAGEEFTIGSPKQLEEILFAKLGLSRKRRGKTGFSTDARVLQAIRDEHEIIPRIESWRELTKLAQTYSARCPSSSPATTACTRRSTRPRRRRAACPRSTRTCRTSPSAPSSAAGIRACFVAAEGNVLVSADYSQVELRILAHIAGEDVLKEIFLRGEDVHTATASRVFGVAEDAVDVGMRSKAKMVNYGIVYGLSAWGMADRLKIPQEEAQEFIDRYLEASPPCAGSSRRRSSRAPSRATWPRCSAAGARSPSCGRGAGRCAARASASP